MTPDATLARWAPAFLLLLARCGGIVAFTPVLGTRALPPPAKAGLAATLALLLTPLAVGRGLVLPADGPGLAATLAGELAIGAVLGLAARFTFAAIGVAGELAGVQMGLVNVARELTGVQFGLINVVHSGPVTFLAGPPRSPGAASISRHGH